MSNQSKYIVTYFVNNKWYDEDEVQTKDEAEEMINVAMHMGVCDRLDVVRVFHGDVVYTYTMSHLCGMWSCTTHDAVKNTTTTEVL